MLIVGGDLYDSYFGVNSIVYGGTRYGWTLHVRRQRGLQATNITFDAPGNVA